MIKRGSLLSSAIPLGPRRDVAPLKKPSPGTRSLTVYAIIEDSGTQIMVRPGDVIEIDPRTDGSEPKGDLVFDRVLSVSNEDGKGGTVGTPYVEGATVAAEIVAEKKGEKLVSVRYKRRKGMRRKTGHRQQYLTVRIGDISGG